MRNNYRDVNRKKEQSGNSQNVPLVVKAGKMFHRTWRGEKKADRIKLATMKYMIVNDKINSVPQR